MKDVYIPKVRQWGPAWAAMWTAAAPLSLSDCAMQKTRRPPPSCHLSWPYRTFTAAAPAASPSLRCASGSCSAGLSGNGGSMRQLLPSHPAAQTRCLLPPSPTASPRIPPGSSLQYDDRRDAEDAKYGLDRSVVGGSEISVQFAMRGRRRPGAGGPGALGGRAGVQ